MPDPFREFIADLRPARPHGGRQVVHGQPFGVDTHFGEKGFNKIDAFEGIVISFQEMALTLQSAGHEQSVDPALERPQHIAVIQFAGAGHPDDLHVGRIG